MFDNNNTPGSYHGIVFLGMDHQAFRGEFEKSLRAFTRDESIVEVFWHELEKNYTSKGRHYHTLTHLQNLATELKPFQKRFASWDVVVFAIGYHDIVYNVLKKTNEERSAALAVKRLGQIAVPPELVNRCNTFILATKFHQQSDPETNLFTDADLSILGADPDSYLNYTKQIRREYSLYPDLLYNPGRAKVLQHFLTMKRIFKSDEFTERYEDKARNNLAHELNSLSHKS